ncbi:B-box type zinc finger family protein [Striga hermonthica]|uniref:B-box type zinc finger family protein n=1 Tax=Striga hermonthica TaxID=68872 RepID=A0A9N7R829_STRHE|nr:B-box type zinc finger family protein [Striga hermonthica]
MKKECDLCEETARIHCGPDQASLCWTCDAKVHSANFLVARHSRNLLCHVCQSPTPWSAAGSSLRPTVAVCQLCLRGGMRRKEFRVVPPSPQASECSSSGR